MGGKQRTIYTLVLIQKFSCCGRKICNDQYGGHHRFVYGAITKFLIFFALMIGDAGELSITPTG